MHFETEYFKLVSRVLTYGYIIKGRNGFTRSLIGTQLQFDVSDYDFPLLNSRKYSYKGVLGEFAALLRGPKTLEDFIKFGCNYWAKWAEQDLSINVDYGNAWLDFNGVNQLEWLVNEIKNNPSSRRLVISGWKPDNVINNKLSLPCCHYSYQFLVRNDELHIVWIQRSADVMIGIPADAVLAATWLIMLANECGLHPGTVTMQFADTHIYEEHIDQAKRLVEVFTEASSYAQPKVTWAIRSQQGSKLIDFVPTDLEIKYAPYGAPINFLLKE